MIDVVTALSTTSSDLLTGVGGVIAQIFNVIAGIFGGTGD